MNKNIVLAEIHFDRYTYEDGYSKCVTNGYIDRTKIIGELLRLNLGILKVALGDGSDIIMLPCNTVHTIKYVVQGTLVEIDATQYHGKYYDMDHKEPRSIKNREQPKSTLQREKTNNRGLRVRRPKKLTDELKNR